MTTLVLILALMLTLGITFITGILASQYGVNTESFLGEQHHSRYLRTRPGSPHAASPS